MSRHYPPRGKHTQGGVVRVILPVAILLMLAVGGLVWWLLPPGTASRFNMSAEQAVALIGSWGVWGVAGSIALMVAHSFLPFPAEVIALANGMGGGVGEQHDGGDRTEAAGDEFGVHDGSFL